MDLFTKTKKLTAITGAVSLLALGATGSAQAGGTYAATVTAVVLNAITITQTKALDFGKFGLILNSPPTAPVSLVGLSKTGTAAYQVSGASADYSIKVSAPTLGVFAITGAAPSSNINVSYDSGGAITPEATPGDETSGTSIPLTCTTVACAANANLGTLKFAVTDNTTTGVIAADGTGKATLNLAGDVTTDGNATHTYTDGAYTNATALTINISY